MKKIPESLEDCAEGSKKYLQAYLRKEVVALYDRVAVGLFLMKAQELLRRDHTKRRDSNTGQLAKSEEGFQAWIAANKGDVPALTSAYAHITAAKSCGLSVTSTVEDIEKLKAEKFLEGKIWKDLTGPNGKKPAQIEPPKTSWQDETQRVIACVESLNAPDVKEAIESTLKNAHTRWGKAASEHITARLHKSLERITGKRWDVVPQSRRRKYNPQPHPELFEL